MVALDMAAGLLAVFLTVALGYLARRTGIIGADAATMLNRLAFYIATPALYFALLATTDLAVLASPFTAVTAIPLFGLGLIVFVILLIARRGVGPATLFAGSATFTNSANMGIPIAIAALGTDDYIAPIILLQVLVLTPAILFGLDLSRASDAPRTWRSFVRPFANPIIVSTILGVAVALAPWRLPQFLLTPVDMIGDASIPMVLLAFGISLVGARPFRVPPGSRRVVWGVVAAKVLVLPLATGLIGWLAFGLTGRDLLAAVVLAALPSAQSVYNFASQYGVVVKAVRDIVVLTTVLSIPVLLLVAVLLT